jgi:hypothetical protein
VLTTNSRISTYPITDATIEELAVSVEPAPTGALVDTVTAGREFRRDWLGGDHSKERQKRSNGEEAHLSNV